MSEDREPPAPPPDFEASLAELQQIVSDLEEGTLGLEDAMRQFERGMRLLRGCHAYLDAAEQRIEILTVTDADGNPVTEDFDATATHDPSRRGAGRRPRRREAAETPPDDEDGTTRKLF